MKTTIIILGLVALSFTNANATTEFDTQVLDQQESATFNVESTQQSQLVFVNEEISNNTGDSNNTDTTVFDPKSVMETTYKTVEDVITEDRLITESKEVAFQPLSLGYTPEDRVEENNQIIESGISNEVFPLDFDKINSNIQCAKINNNALKATDLKL